MTIRTAFLAALLCLPALAQGQDTAFRAGFAQMNITPVVPDTWTDADGNSVYQPDQGDTFTDGNGNGVFDPVWLAGFHQNRPAQAVHDSIYALAAVFDDGEKGSSRFFWSVLIDAYSDTTPSTSNGKR